MKTTRLLVIMLAAPAAGGCLGTVPDEQPGFGDSVRNMVRAQTYDANAAVNPSPDAPEIVDGQYGEAYLDTYRSSIGDPGYVKVLIENTEAEEE